ncbi:hypothetical protein L3X38_001405 [Prunus dulcis]|uniref:Uncharacterized protein n=1 Tax=Prunus dulcis TaxID=3755 RepID=A0AAD4ZKB3_PRUDU|nr:hypothetical protein L3X38_001405 [Prunus dulcis]
MYRRTACYGNNFRVFTVDAIVAANRVIWNNKKACGSFYDVFCIGAVNSAISNSCKYSKVEPSIFLRRVSDCLLIPRLGELRFKYHPSDL